MLTQPGLLSSSFVGTRADMGSSVPLIMERGVPVITGFLAKPLCHANGPVLQRGDFLLFQRRIHAPLSFVACLWPTGRPCHADYTQYGVNMASSCSMVGLAWSSLTVDTADPGDVSTIHAAFGACVDFPVMGLAPDIDRAVASCGLFRGTAVDIVSFPPSLWQEMALSLEAHSSKGPVAAVFVALGATRAMYIDPDGAWLFDSHGIGGAAASVDYFVTAGMMARVLEREGMAVGEGGAETQLAVFRQLAP